MAEIKKKWYKRWWAITLFVIIILGVIGSFLPKTENNNNNNNSQIVDKPTIPNTTTWHEVTSFSGKGNKDTSSFYIKGEKVRITATTCCGSTGIGTYSAVDLESESGGYIGVGLSISTDGSEEGTGETIYRNLDVGEYYISVITGVNWEVKVEEYY